MRRFLTATAIAASLAAAMIVAAPAEAANARGVQTVSATRSAAMAGPGGCEGFNRALTEAVATQIRTGKQAEARRLMRLFQACGR
jgi:hypothetical protein